MSAPLLYDPTKSSIFKQQALGVIHSSNPLLLTYKDMDAVVDQTSDAVFAPNLVSAQRFGNVLDLNFTAFKCNLASDVGQISMTFSGIGEKLRDLLPASNTQGLVGGLNAVVENAVIKQGATTSTYTGPVHCTATVLVNTAISVGKIALTVSPPAISYTSASVPVFAAGSNIVIRSMNIPIPVYQLPGQGPW